MTDVRCWFVEGCDVGPWWLLCVWWLGWEEEVVAVVSEWASSAPAPVAEEVGGGRARDGAMIGVAFSFLPVILWSDLG